ncbi:MAG TPA: LysE family translocator [Burkholderiales bacterium]|nr:LysE family translocator [Burkholderiales bacterium]
MPAPATIALFMAAALALNLTPGPDMLYVTARSVSDGRRAGIVAALGVGAGTLVHIAALALGLAALLAAVPLAYELLRIAGAVYLLIIGVQLLFRPRRASAAAVVAPASHKTIFAQAVLTNVLNPKVALFFLAFLPQFVDPAAGPTIAQIVLLGLLFDIQGTAVNVAVALLASSTTRRLRVNATAASLLQRFTGAILVTLGVRLAAAANR